MVEMVDVSAAMLYRVSSADLKFEGHPPKSFPWPCRMASAHVVAGVRESVMQLVASGSRAELLSERPIGVDRHYGPLVGHAGSPITGRVEKRESDDRSIAVYGTTRL